MITINTKLLNERKLSSDLTLLSGKNWLYLEVIKVFISILNKIKSKCKIISAPAPREYSTNYNNLIDKARLSKNQGFKIFCVITNVRLDRSGVKMAFSMMIGNHWSCVRINLETGDGLYADSIGQEVPHDFGVKKYDFIKSMQVGYEIQ